MPGNVVEARSLRIPRRLAGLLAATAALLATIAASPTRAAGPATPPGVHPALEAERRAARPSAAEERVAAPAVAAPGPPDAPASSDALERPSIATLPPLGDHWVWVPDRLLEHSLLFDGDDGRVLGMIDSPGLLTPQAPLVSRDRKEIYSVDVDYARGRRGKRSDFVTVYDLETMKVKGEIDFPTRAGSGNTAIAYSALVGPRFLAVFNQFPASSVSIIDLERRRFVGEIGIAGCSGVYPVDELRFATLCGNGATAVV
ncbi:MAG TPA: amine dehydrogenase large subunit, partial [Myxococcota bacterium]|nr:amine dehydrogenase large subunit [Myxococcota bacterium]